MGSAQLDPTVAEVIREATVEGKVLRLPEGQLERTLYLKVKKTLEAIGAKWDRKMGGHVLSEPDSHERLLAIQRSGEVQAIDNLGYFPTPPALVERLLELSEVEPGHTVLEPSAGRGAISRRLLEIVGAENLHVVELQQKHADVLASEGYVNLTVGDFITTEFPCCFDRVVMNPPFERQQDIDHAAYAYQLLKPGGRLVSIMGATAMSGSRQKSAAFRDLVEAHGWSEGNRTGSFKASGTSVSTINVVLTKPLGGKDQ